MHAISESAMTALAADRTAAFVRRAITFLGDEALISTPPPPETDAWVHQRVAAYAHHGFHSEQAIVMLLAIECAARTDALAGDDVQQAMRNADSYEEARLEAAVAVIAPRLPAPLPAQPVL